MHVSQIASQPSQLSESRQHGQTGQAAQRSVSAAEFALLFLVLIVFTEGLLPRLVTSEQGVDGSPVLRLLWLPVYALIGLGLMWRARETARTCLRLPFLIGLLLLSALSFLWSIDPGLTQRRSLALIMTSAAGLYLGTRYTWQTLLRALGAVWLTIGLASLATALLVPEFGRAQDLHDGAWKGLYFEKNQLGGHMALAALITAFLSLMDRRFRRVWLSAFALSAALVVLSTSKTALLGIGLGLAVLATGALMKRGLKTSLIVAWLGSVIAATLGLILWLAPDLIFDLLGREASLTGRTDIWAALTGYIEQRPLFGYGYGAFWAEGSAAAKWVRETLQWDAPTAHNGWLDVALALGVTGLVLLVLDFLVTLIRAVLAAFQSWAGLFALAFCAQFLLFSLSESVSLQQNSILWVIYVALAAKLANRPQGLFAFKSAWRGAPGLHLSPPPVSASRSSPGPTRQI